MGESADADLSHHLPLRLMKSEMIPPAPNGTKSGSAAIDWLPDFAGYSWVAYGASSLLVISHFPSPLSPQESGIGPLFRQVFELPSPRSADVTSVSWSPLDPSTGDLAAAADNRIFIFQYDSGIGSFCWSQTALLLQHSKVKAIAWTGSGDGIISVGTEVVLWKRNIKSWEIAWKFRLKVSQTLVASTWSLTGPSATGAYPNEPPAEGLLTGNTSNCVNVFQKDEKFGYLSSQLRHPYPVLAIQWRPSGGSQSNRDALFTRRHVLLTSCLDGAVRLWSEIDGNRTRRSSKDNRDASASARSFCVVAVIEINQSLGGTLGTDIFLHWALEVEGLVCVGGGNQPLCAERCQNDEVGRCEWLIGFGPSKKLTFWAVHCFDDIVTMRSPRITLWKRLEVQGSASRSFCRNNEASHFEKVGMWRNRLFGPPEICSLVQLLSCNSLAWSLLYSQSLPSPDESSSECGADSGLSYHSEGFLDTFGHAGKILQVAVHPFKCEVELTVSLDSNGLLIFWSTVASSSGISSLPMVNPSWQLVGKMTLQGIISHDMSLHWAPSLLDKDRILLIQHVRGIDCLIVRSCENKEDNILCHKLCTIPLTCHDHINIPDKIVSVPLRSTCEVTFKFNEFLLLGLWMKDCQVESWKVTLHSYEIPGNCCKCDFATTNNESGTWIYRADFGGKGYCVVLDSCSSYLPDVHDQVTSVVMVYPNNMMPLLQESQDLVNDCCLNNFPYHMATGHSDGRSRLWKISLSESSLTHLCFELVGMFNSLQGPVTAISVAHCGQKIATVCPTGDANNENMLYIWEPLHLARVGTIEVQDKICMNGNVVALHWFLLEGILFLGVCFQNELHIYSQRLRCGQNLSDVETSEASMWVCIAVAHTSPTISDFLVGHRATFIIVHEKYFSLFSQWSFLMDNKDLTDGHLTSHSVSSLKNAKDKEGPTLFTRKFHIFEEEPSEKSGLGSTLTPPLTKAHNDTPSYLVANGTQPIDKLQKKSCFVKLTEMAEKFCGPLPVYHPEALLMNIYSGNWKRAYVAVCHLVQFLASNPTVHGRVISPKSGLIVEQVKLSNYFEGQLSSGESVQGFQWSQDVNSISWSSYSERRSDSSVHDAMNSIFPASATSSKAYGSHEMLEKLHVLESITDSQKMRMFAIVDLLQEISNSQSVSAYGSLDEPGRRFWCAIRLQQLERQRRYSRMPSIEELVVDSMMIGWAFHSDCQANLFSSILPTEPTWEEMRKMGVGFWFANLTELRSKMEKLARCQYLKNKDPKACALLYIALNRLQVLAGLFKLSRDEKDKPLFAFLLRNFQEEKHKAAALKNAYVLMGRHQYELAIAFFLLGGDIMSAVTVCAKNLGDDQLAIVICRLVEGQGGPSERHLISRILLPSAIEKGDFWLASILEWISGNYLQSFLIVLGLQGDSHLSESEKSFKNAAFQEPSVGQYCQMLAAKNSLRNAVGEHNAAILCRWATVMTASAFSKCGLPLEALEWLSSSTSSIEVIDKGINSGNSEILPRIMWPFPADSSRWLSHEVSCHLEYQVKLDLAVQYIMKLMREHPCWLDTSLLLSNASACSHEQDISKYRDSLGKIQEKLHTALTYLEQKFSLTCDLLLKKVFVSLDDDRRPLIGYHLLRGFASQVHMHTPGLCSSLQLLKQTVNTIESLSSSFSRFVIASSTGSSQVLVSAEHNVPLVKPYCCFQYSEFYLQHFICLIHSVRASLTVLYNGSSESLIAQAILILDLCNYCIYFASAMSQRNINTLAIILRPVLVSCTGGNYGEIDTVSLREILGQTMEVLSRQSSSANKHENAAVTHGFYHENAEDRTFTIPEDEKWIVLGTCLWLRLSNFIKHQLDQFAEELSWISTADISGLGPILSPELDDDGFLKYVIMIFIEALRNSVTEVSSHSARQLAIFFWQKFKDETSMATHMWLEEFIQSSANGISEHLHRMLGSSEMLNEETSSSCSELLAKICADPKFISEILAQLPIKLSQLTEWKPVRGWNQLNNGVLGEHERLESYKQEGVFHRSPNGSPSVGSEQNHGLLDSGKKGAPSSKKVVPFLNPREIYRRSGELLEALCINSIQQNQAAVASNKKGVNFFHWADGLPSRDSSYYIWSNADWPRKGWAGTDSTPVPTYVSPGVGLASDKGSFLGLGGATLGVGSQTRAGRDLTNYAGLGWEIQEDFDNYIDPPATLDNINARTLASHPSRPFFLVGSINTHIYLWEFGEEKAAATYGVLPAASIPPPYALASITALQFDRCGHRFANCASDGTVCTWQLEVGGRSNVRPTDACLCFNGHASDICYVATSGSIIAAAGYSSNGVNVVIWDTLAPPASSRASVMCHEGGACSIAVFDNDMGTSSVTPLIVTGGKEGDVGLHDFRYIATGKTKRHRHHNERITDIGALDVPSELSSKVGDQNRHGMLWYIPKAHSGSITKITTIPNTNFFLTGSKDGDVKLWDARRASLVFHWPKLHERQTFLQRSSQGFGGMSRVGVTDIQAITDGFLTCGGDGSVKLVQLNNSSW